MSENTEPASFYAKLPSTTPEWWDESTIALWVYENVYRVMQERTEVRITARDKNAHTCKVIIQGIPNEKRRRIRDVLTFTGMEQLNDPNGDTGEMFV